jgi:hypothetical protein
MLTGRALGDDRIAYQMWALRVQATLARHQPVFGSYGAQLSLSGVHGGQWIEIQVGFVPGSSGEHVKSSAYHLHRSFECQM